MDLWASSTIAGLAPPSNPQWLQSSPPPVRCKSSQKKNVNCNCRISFQRLNNGVLFETHQDTSETLKICSENNGPAHAEWYEFDLQIKRLNLHIPPHTTCLLQTHLSEKKSAEVQGATLFFQCANPAVNVYHPTSIQRLLLVLNPRIPAAAFGKSWRAGLFPQMATTSLNEFRQMFKLKTSTIPSLSGMQERFITSRLEEVPK